MNDSLIVCSHCYTHKSANHKEHRLHLKWKHAKFICPVADCDAAYIKQCSLEGHMVCGTTIEMEI